MEQTEENSEEVRTLIEDALNARPLDIRIEVLLAHLIHGSMIATDDIIIRPQGTFRRSYRRDLLKILKKKKPDDSHHYFFDVAREGLYEILPEGLFHRTLEKKAEIHTEASVREIKIHKEEEKATRKFLLPLEQEFYLQRIQLELVEKRYWSSLSQEENNHLFVSFWQLDKKLLTQQQTSILLTLLPFAHQIAGDLPLTAEVIEMMLGEKVRIQQVSSDKAAFHHPYQADLGHSKLGIDFFLGDAWHSETPVLALEIGPVAAEKIPELMPEGNAKKLYELLFRFFMPVEAEVIPQLSVEEEEQDFILSEDLFTSRLNYTTTI